MKKCLFAVAAMAAVVFMAGCDKKSGGGTTGSSSGGAAVTTEGPAPAEENIPESLVYVKGGEFVMGDEELNGKWEGCKPHTVYVDSFYMAKEEVTQGLYESIMGKNPSNFKGDDRPVECVSWYEAVEFCNKLSEKKGLTPCYTINNKTVTCDFNANGYRLPTEAEWEYACRGGAESKGYKYSGSDDLDEVAWWDGNSRDETHPVRSKKTNELGIYDMSGNVWEWCWDWYQKDYENQPGVNPTGASSGLRRSDRGGSWFNDVREFFMPGFRTHDSPGDQDNNLGVRVCRSFLQVPVARKTGEERAQAAQPKAVADWSDNY